MERVRRSLSSLLLPERVVEIAPGESKKDVVARLGRLACQASGVNADHVKSVLDALWERESILSTGIGLGIAVPHVRHANVASESMVVGRSRTGVPFDAIDGKPVHAVFTILMPAGEHRRHVEVLGAIAAALKEPSRRDATFSAPDATGFVARMLATA